MEDAEGLGHIDASYRIGHHAHLVAVTDQRRQQGVGEVFDKLSGIERDAQNGFADCGVYLSQHLGRAVVAHTKHDAVGMDEIIPAMAFAEELGVVGHAYIDAHLQPFLLQIWDDLLRGCRGRNGRFHHQHLIAVAVADLEGLVDSAQQIGEVGLPVLAIRSTHTIIDAVALGDGTLQLVGADGEETVAQMPRQRLVEAWFEKRQAPFLNTAEARRTDFHAIHLVTILRKSERSGQSDKPEAKDSDYHLYSPSSLSFRYCRKRATPSST